MWYWLLLWIVASGCIVLGWCLRVGMENANAGLEPELSRDLVFRWLLRMEKKERDAVLFSLVGNIYDGGR